MCATGGKYQMQFEVYGFPNTRMNRVLWMLEEVGAEYSIIKAAPHSAVIQEINPSGKIPALRAGNDIILDSVAICHYLADLFPEKKMTFKAGTPQRAQLDSFLHFAVSEVEEALWLYHRHAILLPEEQRVPDILPFASNSFQSAIVTLSARLENKPFLFGKQYTVADLNFGFLANWADMLKFEIAPVNVKTYFGAIRKRPALVRAMKREKMVL